MKKRTGADALNIRLNNYSSSIKSGATLSALRNRMGNWSAYAAVTGSALAAATSASAFQIVSYSGPPVTASVTGNNGTSHQGVQIGNAPEFYVAVNRRSYSGFRGYLKAGEGREIPSNGRHVQFGTAVAGVFLSKLSSHSHLRNLASGQAVSSHASNWKPGELIGAQSIMNYRRASTTQRSSQTFKYFFGRWKSGVPGFVGFRFNTTGTAHQVDYGWAEVEFHADANGVPNSVTLLGLAYNANGGPINTGQTGPATPEPGTAGLILLALGAAGVAVLKKRQTPGPAVTD